MMSAIERMLKRMLAPVKRRVSLMVTRAIINLIDDSDGMQLVQLDRLSDVTSDEAEHFQPFGLSSHPPKESEAIGLAVGGDQDHIVAICAQHRDHRPTNLNEGETKIYSAHGNTLLLDSNGNIIVENSSGARVALNGETVHLAEDPASDYVALATKADLRSATIETALNLFISAYNAHTHTTVNHIATGSPPGDPKQVTGIPSTPGVPVAPAGSTAATRVKAT